MRGDVEQRQGAEPHELSALPPTSSPAISATDMITKIVKTALASAPAVAASDRAAAWAASIMRRAKPDSKSRAIAKPVKTPPNAEACSSTKP